MERMCKEEVEKYVDAISRTVDFIGASSKYTNVELAITLVALRALGLLERVDEWRSRFLEDAIAYGMTARITVEE